jgi:hypothetical protein
MVLGLQLGILAKPHRFQEDTKLAVKTLADSFYVTPEKRLALDREDWKAGRVYSGIDGIQVGNLTIKLGRVVLASGRESLSDGGLNDDMIYSGNVRNYVLVGEIPGECPVRATKRRYAVRRIHFARLRCFSRRLCCYISQCFGPTPNLSSDTIEFISIINFRAPRERHLRAPLEKPLHEICTSLPEPLPQPSGWRPIEEPAT